MLLVEVLGTGGDDKDSTSTSDVGGSPQDMAGSSDQGRTISHAAAGPGE